MKHFLSIALSIFLMLFTKPSSAQIQVSFFVVSHPDQWQVFMGDVAGNDMIFYNNPVFIYLTSGDQSCGPGAVLNTSHYLTKEEGARQSIELLENSWTNDVTWPFNFTSTWSVSTPTFNGHQILKYEYKGITNYFLRLVDGCGSHGFNGESLEDFYNGTIPTMTAVDNSETYTGWSDLVNTINAIMVSEVSAKSASELWLNTADNDRTINPNDFPDRYYAAEAGISAFTAISNWHGMCLFQGDNCLNFPSNLSEDAIILKAGLSGVADFKNTDLNEWSTWNWALGFLSRNYNRVVYH